MRKIHLFISGLFLIGGVLACKQEDIGPTDVDIFESNKVDILNYAQSKGITGSFTPNGVYYAVTKPSTSTVSPTTGQEVEFSYKLYALQNTGSLVTDVLIDSTYGTKSTYTTLGGNDVGVGEGLLKMREGEQAAIMLPSVYAFGREGAGNGVVPPNTPVLLNVNLKRTRTEDQQINEYLTANKLTPTEVTMSGLRFIRTLENPNGDVPTPTQTLTIKYRGQLLRATSAFDSTGNNTYSSQVSQFVPGFAEGLSKLRVGEKATIVFPSKIGYGTTGYQIIPAYAPLRFDIELVSVR